MPPGRTDSPLPPSLPVFDPRTVPVVGVDAHLPRVRPAAQRPDALRQRFAAPPPWTPSRDCGSSR